MRLTALFTLFLTIASLTAFSQPRSSPKPRWKSLLVPNALGGMDTLIQGPRREFVLMATYRVITDGTVTNIVQQLSNKNRIIGSLENELSIKTKALMDCAEGAQGRMDAMGKLQNERDGWRTLAEKNKAWATVGKVGTATVVVSAVVVSIVVLNREFQQ